MYYPSRVIPLVVIGTAVLMIALEATGRGRSWPRVRGWWPRAIALNGVQLGVAFLAASTWDLWMADRRPWSTESLGTAATAALGYVAITFVYYWWHRARHVVPFLWRWFHQVHHSPQRIEIVTSFYKHPFEIVVNGVLSSAIVYFLVGATPEAATWAVLATGLAELFYHWNVPTPYWLGFLIQRPESHCVHHEEGLHHFNYGDLPLWDMLFGTFRNPRRWEASCGFGDAAEHRLGDMLRGREVTS